MADFDPIGPLKPAVPPANRKERRRKPDRDARLPKPNDEKRNDGGSRSGPSHQVDEYA